MGGSLSKQQAALPLAYQVVSSPTPASEPQNSASRRAPKNRRWTLANSHRLPTPPQDDPSLGVSSIEIVGSEEQANGATRTPAVLRRMSERNLRPQLQSLHHEGAGSLAVRTDTVRSSQTSSSSSSQISHTFSLNDLHDQSFADDEEEEADRYERLFYQYKGNLRTITFGQLSSLATIGLCKQNIVAMSPNIGLLATTTTLHLCCNSLTEIPLEIGYLRNLTHLHISNNKLTTLPDTLGYLTKLVELHASDNRITTLPSSIASLKKLTVLDLKRNEISALPSEMGELKSLVTLELADNPINQLPAEITRLKFLRKIGLDNCPLDLDVLEDHADELATPPTLRELAARVIVRQQLPILEITHDHLKHYLASAQSCTSCAGPYFESTIIRRRVVTRNEVQIPLEYKLCTRHWESDHGRVAAMFCPPPETAPTPPTSLPSSPFSSPPGSPLLERRRKSSMRAGSLSSSTLPLSSLAKTPILPSLPPEASAVEARGLKTTLLLKRGALRSSRSLSFISLPAGRSQ